MGWMVATWRYAHWKPVSVTLFGERVFVDTIKNLKTTHSGSHWALNPMTRVLRREEETHREKATQQQGQRLEWGSCKPEATKDCPQPRQGRGSGRILPQGLQEDSPSTAALISKPWPPELWKNKFLWFYTKFAVICYGSQRKLTQMKWCPEFASKNKRGSEWGRDEAVCLARSCAGWWVYRGPLYYSVHFLYV